MSRRVNELKGTGAVELGIALVKQPWFKAQMAGLKKAENAI